MAIAASFDLEMIQYDAVNASVHAKLDEEVFMKMPQGYSKRGAIQAEQSFVRSAEIANTLATFLLLILVGY